MEVYAFLFDDMLLLSKSRKFPQKAVKVSLVQVFHYVSIQCWVGLLFISRLLLFVLFPFAMDIVFVVVVNAAIALAVTLVLIVMYVVFVVTTLLLPRYSKSFYNISSETEPRWHVPHDYQCGKSTFHSTSVKENVFRNSIHCLQTGKLTAPSYSPSVLFWHR